MKAKNTLFPKDLLAPKTHIIICHYKEVRIIWRKGPVGNSMKHTNHIIDLRDSYKIMNVREIHLPVY